MATKNTKTVSPCRSLLAGDRALRKPSPPLNRLRAGSYNQMLAQSEIRIPRSAIG